MTRLWILLACTLFADLGRAWTPTGAQDQPTSKGCQPHAIEQKYFMASDAPTRRQILQATLDDCQAEWSLTRPQGLLADAKMLEIGAVDTRLWKPVDVEVGKGRHMTGYLALQPDGGRHPLAIVECDWNSDPKASPEVASLYMHLFEEAGWHVLMLHSPYSVKGALSGRELVAGGLGRGADLLRLGLWIWTESPFRQKLLSLHLVGTGWGGHSAQFALMYNDYNPIADDRKVFNSALLLCPVVQLDSALHSAAGPNQNSPWSRQLWDQIAASRSQISELEKVFQLASRPADLIEKWVLSSFNQLKLRPQNEWALPVRGAQPLSEREFLEASNFASRPVGLNTPSWLLGAEDDATVQWSQQGKLLQDQNLNSQKSKLTVFTTHQGSHCAYDVTHGWATTGALLRSLLLDQAYEIWPRRSRLRLPLKDPTPGLPMGAHHVYQSWRVVPGEANLTLTYHLLDEERPECLAKARPVPQSCVRQVQQLIPFDHLPPGLAEAPKDSADAERLTRKLNVQLQLLDPSGEPLIDSAEPAAFIEWNQY